MNGNNPGPVTAEPAGPPGFPGRPTAAWGSQPVRVIVEQGGLARVFRWLPWVLLGISVMVSLGMVGAYHSYLQPDAQVNESLYSHEAAASDKIAIIDLAGMIVSGEGFIKRQIDRAGQDDDVRAIVLRVDSPGGTITGSHGIYHRLREMCRKKRVPLVVSMGSIAASGGYYVAMASGVNRETGFDGEGPTIFAEPTTTTGSIGVILPHYNLAGLMDEWKIEDDSIKSHAHKDMGSVTRKMSDVERAKFQAYVDDSFQRFKDVIAYGRPHFAAHREELDALATGEIFTARQAVANKLVDQEGFIEDAIDRAIELAGLDEGQVRVVRYDPPASLKDLIGLEASAAKNPLDLAALLDATAPRGYYLYSALPALAGQAKER